MKRCAPPVKCHSLPLLAEPDAEDFDQQGVGHRDVEVALADVIAGALAPA